MLLRILKGRQTILLVFVPVIIVLLWLGAFLTPVSLTMGQTQMPLYEFLRFLTGDSNLLLTILACVLLVLMAYGMVRLNEQYIFIRQRTNLPAFVFAFIATGAMSLGGMHPSLPAAFLMFLAIDNVFKIYQGVSTLAKSFNVGFLLGTATLFYLFAGVYLVWFLTALLILGYLRLKEVLAGLVGFIAPLFLAFGWLFWTDALLDTYQAITSLVSNSTDFTVFSTYQFVYWGILGFFVLIASVYMLTVYDEKKISSRKYFIILLSFFLTSALSFTIFRGAGVEQYYISIIPVTYIASHFLVFQKRLWIGELFFSILVISSILIHFLG